MPGVEWVPRPADWVKEIATGDVGQILHVVRRTERQQWVVLFGKTGRVLSVGDMEQTSKPRDARS